MPRRPLGLIISLSDWSFYFAIGPRTIGGVIRIFLCSYFDTLNRAPAYSRRSHKRKYEKIHVSGPLQLFREWKIVVVKLRGLLKRLPLCRACLAFSTTFLDRTILPVLRK